MTFSLFARHLSNIDATTKRLEMTDLLVALLKKSSENEIEHVVYLSLGQLAPLYANKEFGLAEKMVIRAAALAFGVSEAQVKKLYKQRGDLGTVAESLVSAARTPRTPLTVSEVFSKLTAIADEHGEGSQERKITGVATLLQSLDSLGIRYAVRIILDKLRLGFSDKTVLDALSVMIAGDKSAREQLEAAYNVRPDVGWLAKEIKRTGKGQTLQGLTFQSTEPVLGIPVLPALCQRLPSTEEIIEKMSRVAVEPKWDGQRIQAHLRLDAKAKGKRQKKKVEVQLFTRSLENVTDMFPDLVAALSSLVASRGSLAASFILDGEVVGIDPKTGRTLPFQTMITRKRKYGIQEQLLSVPIRYIIFDILMKDGKSLLNEPFSSRRAVLEKLLRPLALSSSSLKTLRVEDPQPSLLLAPQLVTDDAGKIRTFFDQQQEKGLEGIVAKKWDSPYSPGRTGFHWVKLKWEGGAKSGGLLDTVDCVVMGTYAGRGKRSGFGVGAFLVGVFDGSSGNFQTISKIGTGLSDEQWRELRAKGQGLRAKGQPKEYDVPKQLIPDRWLRPELIAEIQADNITKSPLHTAGFALRFPRLVRYRPDKKSEQTTSTEEVKRLFKFQK